MSLRLTSAFLNAAIGQLYGTFSEGQIRSQLKVEDVEPDDLALLKRVVDHSQVVLQRSGKIQSSNSRSARG